MVSRWWLRLVQLQQSGLSSQLRKLLVMMPLTQVNILPSPVILPSWASPNKFCCMTMRFSWFCKQVLTARYPQIVRSSSQLADLSPLT